MEGPRRILMTVDAVGGVWQYALGLAGQLARSDHFVVLAGLGPLPSPDQKSSAERTATVEWLHTPPEWMAPGEQELGGLGDEIARLVETHAIDLVQVNEPGQATGLEVGCPIVAVSHSCIATWFRAVRGTPPPRDWLWHEERTRKGMNRADVVIAPSASHEAALTACYGRLSRLIVVHNAVSPCVETMQRKQIVFAAGRWWDDGKNGDVLDRAARETDWPIFAAGATTGPSGDARPFRNVTSLGAIPNSEARRLVAECGIFVSPSLYEPFGLAALEAAAAGTPLVLADIPTYRELWSHAAFFFPPRDASSLAAVLNRLAGDAPLRCELGVSALRRSRAYTQQRHAAGTRAAYRQALAIHAGRA